MPPLEATQLPAPVELGGGEIIQFAPEGAFTVPVTDLADFNALTDQERERIKLLFRCFERMAAGSIVAQSNILAVQLRHLRGFSPKNLQTLYYAYRAGGWRAVVRGYKGPAELPADFVDFFRALTEKNHRSINAAIAALRRLWRAGEAIPGYGTWREWFVRQWPERDLPPKCPGFPKGWSRSNLYLMQPPKAERAIATKGVAAARKYLPHVIRDTSQLRPLELITIDDFEIDQLCVFGRSVCRVTGLLAMDVATRRRVAFGLKPRVENEDGKKEAIRREDLRTLLYSLFAEHGLPPYTVTILCENAAAGVEADMELAFSHLFGGRIRFTRTGLIEHRTLANGFLERGGKPWQKGWIESAFNAMHNVAAALPGQKGSRYDNAPGDLPAKILYTERLLAIGPRALNLTDDQVAQLRVPFERVEDLIEAYERIFDLLESRTEHNLQGFRKVREWRLHESQPWQPFKQLAMLPPDQQLIAHIRERGESPAERWEALTAKAEFAPIPEEVLALMLFTAKRAKIKGSRITFVNLGKGYTYCEADSAVMRKREGTEVLCYFDPAKMDTVHVTDLQGRYLGSVKRLGPADIRDPDAISQAAAVAERIYHRHLGNVRRRHQDNDDTFAADDQWNRRLAGLPRRRDPSAALESMTPAATMAPSVGIEPEGKSASSRPASLSQALKKADSYVRDAFAAAKEIAAGAAEAEQQAARTTRLADEARRRKRRRLGDLVPEQPNAAAPAESEADDETDRQAKLGRLL